MRNRIHSLIYDFSEGVAERRRMRKTDSMDPDPEMGHAYAEFHRKLRESKERTDAEKARRAEQRQADDEVHRHPDPDAR